MVAAVEWTRFSPFSPRQQPPGKGRVIPQVHGTSNRSHFPPKRFSLQRWILFCPLHLCARRVEMRWLNSNPFENSFEDMIPPVFMSSIYWLFVSIDIVSPENLVQVSKNNTKFSFLITMWLKSIIFLFYRSIIKQNVRNSFFTIERFIKQFMKWLLNERTNELAFLCVCRYSMLHFHRKFYFLFYFLTRDSFINCKIRPREIVLVHFANRFIFLNIAE